MSPSCASYAVPSKLTVTGHSNEAPDDGAVIVTIGGSSTAIPFRLCTAAYASSSPAPKVLFGLPPAALFPQDSFVRSCAALPSRSCAVLAGLPTSSGTKDQSNATTPATCGLAIEVPLFEA